MTKFATYQRPRTGKADGPFGATGKGPRWSNAKPGPFAPIRKVPDPAGPALPDLETLLKASDRQADKD